MTKFYTTIHLLDCILIPAVRIKIVKSDLDPIGNAYTFFIFHKSDSFSRSLL